MPVAKVKLDFISNLNVSEKIQYGRDRNDDMQASGNFTTPDVAYATITTNNDNLETTHLAAAGGGPAQTAAMYAAEKVWDTAFRKQCAYVDRIADGDEVIIKSGGFDVTKTVKGKAQVPAKVEGVQLSHGEQAGTIGITSSPVEGAKFFVALATADKEFPVISGKSFVTVDGNTAPVIIHAGTSRNKTIDGLTSGTRVYVKMYAVNAAGKGADSDVISIIVP
jgi:hypothetical protein